MKDPLADWYRHHFETISGDAPSDGWQQIQQRLHNSQRIDGRILWPTVFLLFALQLLPLMLGVNHRKHPAQAGINVLESQQVQTTIMQSARNPLGLEKIAQEAITDKLLQSQPEQYSSFIESVEEIPLGNELSLLKSISAALPINAQLPEINQHGTVWPNTESSMQPKSKWARNFSLGTFCFGTASVLLNREFCYSLRKETNNGVAANYGLSYGILAGYRLNARNGIEAELFLNEASGQIYNRYKGGKYVRQQLGLNYRGLAFLMNTTLHQVTLRNNIPLAFSMSFGIAAMKLQKQEIQFNDLAEPTYNSPYRSLNFSAITAACLETRLKGNVILGVQVRLTGGLTNIFKGSSEIPAWFNRTHTANVSTGLSLRKVF